MHYKHLSLALLTVASVCADRLPNARPSMQLPPLTNNDLSLPQRRLNGGPSASTNPWDHVSDNNALKRICTGSKRNQALCTELETFYRTAQALGTKTRQELQAADQMNTQKPLSMQALQIESSEDEVIIENGARAATPHAALNTELMRITTTMPNLTDEDMSEVVFLAPLINFACNAGTTRREQKSIVRDVAMFMMMKMAEAQEQMAQQQQAAPMRFPRG